MKNCLLLLTSEYPFGKGETFLELEMPYIGKSFDKIIIIAVDAAPGAVATRKIPMNSDCYNAQAECSGHIRYNDVIKGSMHIFKASDLVKTDKKYIGSNLAKRVFLEYFLQRSEREYRKCTEILSEYDFSSFDSVTVYSYWLFVTAMIGSRLKNDISKVCSNVRFITRAHRYDLYEDRNQLNYLPMREYLLDCADAVYPCSLDGERHLKSRFPQYANKIKCSYLGTYDRGRAKASLSEFHIVSCSNAVAVKRLDLIVDSLALLKDSGMNIKWTHIGDGKLLNDIKHRAESKLGFMTVEFKGRISNTEVLDYYADECIDAFVNVSSSEGLPVSLMEAASFGIPVIATDVGGTGEIVSDGYNGMLLPADFKPNELSETVKRFAGMTAEQRLAFRSNSRKKWEDCFNAERNYSEFADMLLDGVMMSV